VKVNWESLYLAPLFVWLEILFAFGYRPALKKSIDEQVQADKLSRAAKVNEKKE
jgi:2-hydroxy fatty acid dioxygenase